MTVAPINSQLPPYPNIHEAARIYGEWINDHGGINGRPLEVILCDGKGDPNEDANCGRQAAEEGVVALVGSFTFDASQLIPILEEENIAMFGSCCPIAEIEFSSPISFVTGSNFAIAAGAVPKMVDDGCEAPAVVYIETAIARLRRRSVAKDGLRVQGLRPRRRQVRHDPASPPRTTAPRSPRRSTAPTASTAASPTRTGRRSCRRCSRSAARSASTATRAT